LLSSRTGRGTTFVRRVSGPPGAPTVEIEMILEVRAETLPTSPGEESGEARAEIVE